MEGRLITELHGNIFRCSDYKIQSHFPRLECQRGGTLVLDRDITTHTSFILVKRADKTYGYIFYENQVYIYGELKLIKYKPEIDMRHVKNRD